MYKILKYSQMIGIKHNLHNPNVKSYQDNLIPMKYGLHFVKFKKDLLQPEIVQSSLHLFL